MAQYTIKQACGHSVTTQIYGSNSHGERDYQERRIASQMCKECERAEQLAEAQQDTQSMAALTGSEKQIKWATTIRATALRSMSEFIATDVIAQAHTHGIEQSKIDEAAAMYLGLVNKVMAHTSASWWIDRRNDSPRQLIKAEM